MKIPGSLFAKRKIREFNTRRLIPNLDKSQWWSYERLLHFQEKRLRKIISYSYDNIPGYQSKFNNIGIMPDDIRDLGDLKKIPITTREELQDNPDYVNQSLIAGTLYTGGSTGTTLRYYECSHGQKMRLLGHQRGWRWNGYDHGRDSLAVIASAQGTVSGENVLHLCGNLTSENLQQNVKLLLEYKPRFLRGYVSSLFILAKYCIDHSITIDFIQSINPISENLYDFQRQLMEHAFQCQVFEEYVCNDGGACGWECGRHNGLHYTMERSIIECVDGDMVVTDLWNRAMPFIRYKNGDSVSFIEGTCSCGRELPLMKVKGRANDIIISPRGPISPSFLVHHGCGMAGPDKKITSFQSGIQSVQYVQKPGYNLEVNVVKNPWCTLQEMNQFRNNLQKLVGDMNISITDVEVIPTTSKGKRHFIINQDPDLLKQWRFK